MSAKANVEPTWDDCMELLDRLPTMSLEARAEAIAHLVRNSSPGVRGRALRVGATVLSDDRVVEYLRKGDDGVLRNAGLEMLKLRSGKGFNLAVELLKDRDDDVVLQAVLALDHYKDPRALEPLRSCLDHRDINVIQGAIVAIGHLGDARAILDLLPFLKNDPWLQLAAIEALGDLRSPAAVRPLARLLTDMMLGSMAAEALARIGGAQAFRVLAEHWLRFREDLGAEPSLGLLAHVLEGLPRTPAEMTGLRPALCEVLETGSAEARASAARTLIALGPQGTGVRKEDRNALATLAETQGDPNILPSCLARRKDLIGHLLRQQGILTAWGFLLASRFPKETPLSALHEALTTVPPLEFLDAILKAMERIRNPKLAASILGLYVRLPIEYRTSLEVLFPARRAHLREALDGLPEGEPPDGIDAQSRLVLEALLGTPAKRIVQRLEQLPPSSRAAVLTQVTDRRDVLTQLPWDHWLREEPEVYASVAAEVAIAGEMRHLLPHLRQLLEHSPNPVLVRAVGELGDGESVVLLVRLLERQPSELDPLILESLGRVGGPEARQALREAALSKEDSRVRMAYRALSLCATRDDDTFFRQAVAHGDWFVRLSCAEVLGRFSRPENMAALAQLAADPVPIVSQRALSFLEA